MSCPCARAPRCWSAAAWRRNAPCCWRALRAVRWGVRGRWRGDEALLALRERVIDALESLGRASAAEAASAAAVEKGRERDALDWMELWARDRMAVENGAEPFQLDQAARLARSKLDGQRLLRAVMRARRELESNVSWDNVLSAMLLSL